MPKRTPPCKRTTCDEPAELPDYRPEDYSSDALRWQEQPEPALARGSATPQSPQVRTARVLVVDDDADSREYLSRLLGRYYHVVVACDGEAALRAINDSIPDAVITAAMMPRCGGFQLLRRLRADSRTSAVPVLLISGRKAEDSRVDGLDGEADDYLEKPFSVRELLARVDSQIRLSDVRRAAERRERELRQISEARQQRLQVLTELSPILLDASLDLSDALAKLARHTVPRIADWCYIDLLEADGARKLITIHHRDPRKVEWGKELFHRFPARAADSASGECVRIQRTVLLEDVSDEVLRRIAQNEEHFLELRSAGLCSGVIVPLVVRRRMLGVMAVFTAESRRRYGLEDMQIAEEIATRAALAIDNARLYTAATTPNAARESRVEPRTHELKHVQQQYQLLFDASPLPMFVVDRKTKQFLAVNDAVVALYGFSREEMLAMSVANVRPPCDQKFFVAKVPRSLTTDLRLGVWQHQRRDGKLLQLELAIGQIAWNRRPALLVLANDVTERRRAEESLRRANQTLATIFDAAPVAMVAFDLEGRVSTWNPAAERIFGWSAAEAIGLVCPMVPSEGLGDFHDMVRRLVAANVPQPSLLLWWQKKTGERIVASISVAPLRNGSGVATGFLAIVEDVTERERAREAIQGYSERLARLSRQLLEGQEFERRRIARELHDEIGQSLTLLKLDLQESQRPGGANRSKALARLQAGIDHLLHDVRQLCLQLRPVLLDDLGLLPALLAHIDRFNEQHRVRCLLHHEGISGRRFPAAVETAMFRIVQEALTNVVRHADTDLVRITVWADETLLQVRVQDHGRGFQLEQALGSGSSSGLAGMHERAHLGGGELQIITAPGVGTGITLEFPLHVPATPG